MDVGLVTQSWRGWAGDLAKAWAIGAAFAGRGRRGRRRAHAPLAADAGGRRPRRAVAAFGVVRDVPRAGRPRPDLQPLHAAAGGRARAATSSSSPGAPGSTSARSTRSTRAAGRPAANAYVNGLGRTKRVVLFDTLLRDFDARRGPARRRPRARATSATTTSAGCSRSRRSSRRPGCSRSRTCDARRCCGDDEPPGPRSLPASRSRRWSSADAGAGRRQPALTPDRDAHRRLRARPHDAPEPFIGFEKRITVQNVAEPEPPRWAEVLFGTHPTTLERIGAAMAFRDAARPAERRILRQALDALAGAPLGVVVLHGVDQLAHEARGEVDARHDDPGDLVVLHLVVHPRERQA